MSQLIDALAARREAVITQAMSLAETGVTEARDLTAEEQQSFDRMIAEADGLAARMESIVEGERRVADIESHLGSRREPNEGEQRPEGAFGQWARSARVGDGFDLPREARSEQRAVSRYLEQRAMSATAGLGPQSVYGQLWEYAVDASQIMQAGVTVINTADGNTIPMPVASAHATAASAAAGANITASDSALGTKDLGVSKYGYFTAVPKELVDDATFDLEGYLARNAGRDLGKRIGSVAAAAAIAGFTVAGATGPGAAASGTFGNQASAGQGGDLLISLYHSVLAEYRAQAAWVMSDPFAAQVRRLKDTQGQYVWEKSIQVGTPATIEGRPLFYDPAFPTFTGTPATDSGVKGIYFGDWSALAVRVAGAIRFERSTEAGFGNDTIIYRAIVRTGAVVLDPNAVKFLELG